jgi:hypothetical protein
VKIRKWGPKRKRKKKDETSALNHPTSVASGHPLLGHAAGEPSTTRLLLQLERSLLLIFDFFYPLVMPLLSVLPPRCITLGWVFRAPARSIPAPGSKTERWRQNVDIVVTAASRTYFSWFSALILLSLLLRFYFVSIFFTSSASPCCQGQAFHMAAACTLSQPCLPITLPIISPPGHPRVPLFLFSFFLFFIFKTDKISISSPSCQTTQRQDRLHKSKR